MYNTIIFDLGGVIEKIDPNAFKEKLKSFGMKNPENFFSLFGQSDICTLFEIGKIKRNVFIEHLKSECDLQISSKEVEEAWCINQLGISKKTVETLDRIRDKKYKMIVLSNTNAIHAEKIEEVFFKQHNRSFKDMFDKVYYSFDLGLRKPHIEIYNHILKDSQLEPGQCIYIDDLAANLESPAKLGLTCIHHKTNDELHTLEFIQNLIEDSSNTFETSPMRRSKL